MRGSCLCGAVAFEVADDAAARIEKVSVCHCGQCRKQSGHICASAVAPESALTVTRQPKWYEASPTAKRESCPTCGSFLFWKAHDEDTISFSLGSLEAPTGLHLTRHIFVAGKGDYYDITNGLPQS